MLLVETFFFQSFPNTSLSITRNISWSVWANIKSVVQILFLYFIRYPNLLCHGRLIWFYLPDVVCRGDGGLAAGHLPQGHHVVRGQTLIAGTNAVHSSHLNILSFKSLPIFTKDSTDLEWVDSEGGQVGDIVAGLGWVGGDHLVMTPVRLLALPDVDDVVADLWEVDMEGWGPGELNTPRVKLHDERLAWSAGDVWNVHSVRKKSWWRFANLRVSLLN